MSLQQQNQMKPIVQSSLLLQTLSWWAEDSNSRNVGAWFRKVKGNSLEQSLKDMCTLPQSPSSDSTASGRGRVCHHSVVNFYWAEGSVHLTGGETMDDCVTSNSFWKSLLLPLKGLAGWQLPLLCQTWKGSQTETNPSCAAALGICCGFEPEEAQVKHTREITRLRCLWAFWLPDVLEHPNQNNASSPQLNTQNG